MAVSAVEAVTARVFKGGGRRFFSRAAAYRAEAKARMFQQRPCDCDPGTPGHYGADGNTCELHSMDTVRFAKLRDRYARLLAWGDKTR